MLALATCLVVPSCASNHSVSPWGGSDRPTLAPFAQRPDLDAHVRAIDADADALDLRLKVELHGKLPRGEGEIVVRGYAGTDAAGRPTSAVRVATPRGVVMAVGPLSWRDKDRSRATELVVSLAPGAEPVGASAWTQARVLNDGASGRLTAPFAPNPGEGAPPFASGSDLNGDGDPDVVLRSEAGVLEIWAVGLFGASPYPIELTAPPTLALDVDEDGRVDLGGLVAPAKKGATARIDVATFEGGRYTNRSAAAKAYRATRSSKAPASGTPGGK